MILLGIDLETTGLEASTCEIIEVAAVLWDVDSKQPIKTYSTLVASSIPIPSNVSRITGLTDSLIENYGIPFNATLPYLHKLQEECDYLVAHNSKFDSEILLRKGFLAQRSWIDTMTDIPYGENITSRKLSHLSSEHGFLNPFPHRAISDVLTMFKILSQYDIEDIIELSSSETVYLVAKFEKNDPNFNNKKDTVKSLNYRWTGEPEYKWKKAIKVINSEEEIGKLVENKIDYYMENISK